jgi:hypothetical protein
MAKGRSVSVALLLISLIAPALPAMDLPRPASELDINLGLGKHVKLSDYKGKVVAVIIFLTYCQHCQKVIRCLINDQNELGAHGFQVLAAAAEGNAAAAVPGFIKSFSPPFPVGFVEQPVALNFLQHPSVVVLHMPGLAFVDKEGTVRAQYEGDAPFLMDDAKRQNNIHDKIVELLSLPSGAKKSAPKKSTGSAKKAD